MGNNWKPVCGFLQCSRTHEILTCFSSIASISAGYAIPHVSLSRNGHLRWSRESYSSPSYFSVWTNALWADCFYSWQNFLQNLCSKSPSQIMTFPPIHMAFQLDLLYPGQICTAPSFSTIPKPFLVILIRTIFYHPSSQSQCRMNCNVLCKKMEKKTPTI